MDNNNSRGRFTSIGFILAAAGSAVGLGNIWKFPYLAGSSGGGIFLLLYAILVIVVGIPLLIAETAVGRHGQADAYTSFIRISEEQGSKKPKMWGVFGFMSILCVYIIHTYYIVIGGWVTEYAVKVAVSPLADVMDDNYFSNFITSPVTPIVFTAIFALACLYIIISGVQGGIEKFSKIMMPALFVLLIIVGVRAVTLPGAVEGLKYLFVPNVENLNNAGGVGRVSLAAMSQAFWSLSLGQGILIAYGSYQDKNTNIIKNSVWVAVLDTLVALLAGVAVLCGVFAFNMEPSAGTGLLFTTLPKVFGSMGPVAGKLFGLLFFVCVVLAALTSAISQLEVAVGFLIDTFGMNRKKATLIGFAIAFVIACLASLSMGVLSGVTFGGLNIFDGLGWIAETIMLPLGALLVTILVGWVWKPQNALKEITNEGSITFKLAGAWGILIKYVLPIAIAYIWISGVI